MPDLAAEFTIAALQSGKLHADPEAIVEFYNNLSSLLSKGNEGKQNVPASKFPVSNAIKL